MNNEIQILSKSDRTNGVNALESAGFPALRSGLGVTDGKYHFITPNSQEIYATKAISSAKGNFGLTLVAGMLKGIEPHNREVNLAYGLSVREKQFVVTYNHFMAIEPNQSYEIEIANGRVKTLVLSESENLVDTSKVVTKSKKEKAFSI